MKPSISFSKVKQNDLVHLFNLVVKIDPQRFKDWFHFEYDITQEEQAFLRYLIEEHGAYLEFYNEAQLKAQFITPILNKVHFKIRKAQLKDWYESPIAYEFEQVTLSGVTDYMVATGAFAPQSPYFFIQVEPISEIPMTIGEFKQATPTQHPLTQLLAELIVALAINKTTVMRGAYIIGESWKFVILEKTAKNQYHYYTSRGFDSSVEEDLTQIYTNLQAVKHKYCKPHHQP